MFAALADPRRRALLERLSERPQPVHLLAQDAGISRSGVSQHLAVLKHAGLVRAERRGREVIYNATADGLLATDDWLGGFRRRQLSRLEQTTEGVPMHISAIQIPVIDQDRARDFYTDTLGFTLVIDQTVEGWRWISVLPPGGSAALALIKAPAARVWTGISLLCDDIHERYQRWTKAGVTFHGAPTPQNWGATTTQFADIDGNRFELVQMPGPVEDE